MSKIDRQKEKARRARRLAKQQDEVAELSQREENVADEEVPIDEGQESVAQESEVRKDYISEGDLMAYHALPSPTSFEELDALRMAAEKAEQVREVTWDVQDLVRNILHDPFLGPKDKASKMQEVASGFEARVVDAMANEVKKSAEAWQAEAILAVYDRNTSLLQKAADKTVEVSKAVFGSATRKKLVDSDFALVRKEGETKLCKYPIYDKLSVRKALERVAQEDDEDAHIALPRIRAAAKQFGIELEKSAILIEKDAKGDWRWVGRPTNNFIDYQTDIISKSAHEKYMGWLDANPDMAPVFCTWHMPETARTNPVDFWMEQDGAVIMSGVLTEGEAAALFKMQKEVDLGMSFQGLGLRLDKDPRVITDYWMYEVSDLPLDKAANPFTALETMIKEVGMDKLQYLTGIMGSEEKAKAYLEKTGQMQKELQAAGITSKAKDEAVQEEVKTPEAAATLPSNVDELIEKLAKAMEDKFDLGGLEAFVAQAQEDHLKVETLEELVKAMATSTEDALAEKLTPPVGRYAWSRENRPSQSASTKLSKGKEGEAEDELLSKAGPGVDPNYWLSSITNTAPVTQE